MPSEDSVSQSGDSEGACPGGASMDSRPSSMPSMPSMSQRSTTAAAHGATLQTDFMTLPDGRTVTYAFSSDDGPLSGTESFNIASGDNSASYEVNQKWGGAMGSFAQVSGLSLWGSSDVAWVVKSPHDECKTADDLAQVEREQAFFTAMGIETWLFIDPSDPLNYRFVMPNLGEKLDQLIKRKQDAGSGLNSSGFYDLWKAIAEALQAVHNKGFVHRDFNLGNMLVEEREDGYTVNIIDAAFSNRIGVEGFPRSDPEKFNASHIPPELKVNNGAGWKERPADTSEDVYAFAQGVLALAGGNFHVTPALFKLLIKAGSRIPNQRPSLDEFIHCFESPPEDIDRADVVTAVELQANYDAVRGILDVLEKNGVIVSDALIDLFLSHNSRLLLTPALFKLLIKAGSRIPDQRTSLDEFIHYFESLPDNIDEADVIAQDELEAKYNEARGIFNVFEKNGVIVSEALSEALIDKLLSDDSGLLPDYVQAVGTYLEWSQCHAKGYPFFHFSHGERGREDALHWLKAVNANPDSNQVERETEHLLTGHVSEFSAGRASYQYRSPSTLAKEHSCANVFLEQKGLSLVQEPWYSPKFFAHSKYGHVLMGLGVFVSLVALGVFIFATHGLAAPFIAPFITSCIKSGGLSALTHSVLPDSAVLAAPAMFGVGVPGVLANCPSGMAVKPPSGPSR